MSDSVSDSVTDPLAVMRDEFAARADETIRHPNVLVSIHALLEMLGLPASGLPLMGITQLANVVAQVSRAQALGIDPADLVMSPNEREAQLHRLAGRVGGHDVQPR